MEGTGLRGVRVRERERGEERRLYIVGVVTFPGGRGLGGGERDNAMKEHWVEPMLVHGATLSSDTVTACQGDAHVNAF